MDGQDLKKAMEQVHIQDKMQEDIIRYLRKEQAGEANQVKADEEKRNKMKIDKGKPGIKEPGAERTDKEKYGDARTDKRKWNKTGTFRKMGTLAAAMVMAVLVIAVPVRAAIRYLVQERMEQLPKEEVESLAEMMEEQEAPADGFSRPYSESEKERMGELYRAYQKGTFPQGEITRLKDRGQVEENMFCYIEETEFFYFPDRELTDEELLEIIDFNYKRDYALAQNTENQADIKAREEEQKRQQALLQEEGGISQQQAIGIAEGWMETLYGVSIDGMEMNAYLNDDDTDIRKYCVNYSVRSQCYYYFYISAVDGKLLEATSSWAVDLDKEGMEEDRAKEQIEVCYRQAEGILEQLGITDTYKNVYCFYVVEDGKVRGNNLGYYFIREDGSGYRVDFSCEENRFRGCRNATLAEYEMKMDPEYVKERIEGGEARTVSLNF